MSWTNESVEKVINEIRRRAASDPAFREKALGDPRAAVAEVTHEHVPEGFRLRFVENEGAHLTVVLPDLVPADSELNEQELEAVAGGMGLPGIGKITYSGLNPTISMTNLNQSMMP
jgi:hypothetical protein